MVIPRTRDLYLWVYIQLLGNVILSLPLWENSLNWRVITNEYADWLDISAPEFKLDNSTSVETTTGQVHEHSKPTESTLNFVKEMKLQKL
jgi:hypothetical protein